MSSTRYMHRLMIAADKDMGTDSILLQTTQSHIGISDESGMVFLSHRQAMAFHQQLGQLLVKLDRLDGYLPRSPDLKVLEREPMTNNLLPHTAA